MRIPALILIALSLPSAAAAEPMIDAFGFRVGGYGFRNVEHEAHHQAWDDCRMNGVGVFATRALRGPAFLEAGLDLYFADRFPEAGTIDDGMDRVSGLATVAGGLRMFQDARVSPYVQAGIGLELTRVSMAHDHVAAGAVVSDPMAGSFALPVGFVGIGADVRVGARLRLGANARFNVMGHFDHGGTDTLEASPQLAAQGQFFASYSI